MTRGLLRSLHDRARTARRARDPRPCLGGGAGLLAAGRGHAGLAGRPRRPGQPGPAADAGRCPGVAVAAGPAGAAGRRLRSAGLQLAVRAAARQFVGGHPAACPDAGGDGLDPGGHRRPDGQAARAGPSRPPPPASGRAIAPVGRNLARRQRASGPCRQPAAGAGPVGGRTGGAAAVPRRARAAHTRHGDGPGRGRWRRDGRPLAVPAPGPGHGPGQRPP